MFFFAPLKTRPGTGITPIYLFIYLELETIGSSQMSRTAPQHRFEPKILWHRPNEGDTTTHILIYILGYLLDLIVEIWQFEFFCSF